MRLDPDIRLLEEELKNKRKASFQKRFELAQLCKERGYVKKAGRLFLELYQEDNGFSPLLAEFGDFHFLHGSAEAAIELYEQALQTHELANTLEITLRLAICFYRTGEPDTCRQLLHGIVKMDPGFVPAYRPLIGLYNEENNRRKVRSFTKRYKKAKKRQEKLDQKELRAMFDTFFGDD